MCLAPSPPPVSTSQTNGGTWTVRPLRRFRDSRLRGRVRRAALSVAPSPGPCDSLRRRAPRGGGLPGTSARSEARALSCGTASPAPLRFPFGPSSRVNRLANIYLTVQIEHARLEPGAAAAPASGPRGSRTATGPRSSGSAPPWLARAAASPPGQLRVSSSLRLPSAHRLTHRLGSVWC